MTDTGTADLLVEIDDEGVATVVLNRPERLNTFSAPMMRALERTLPALGDDPAVRVVVVTGAGRAFCAGGDVKAMSRGNGIFAFAGTAQEEVAAQQASQRATVLQLATMPKPTIAALNGAVAGAGLSFALACDLRYAATSAVVTTGFVRVGLPGDYGVSWWLTRLVGPARARELCFFSPRVDAAEALKAGLVNDVFPADELMAEVGHRARALAASPPEALATTKGNLNRAEFTGLAECLDAEAVAHVRLRQSTEHLEAAAAFAARRVPSPSV